MKIRSLIYTTVPPEHSPWKRGGFQTVYYPTDMLSSNHLREIERKIYHPGNDIIQSKVSGTFLKVQGVFYYHILVLKSLPAERDEYGRRGVFLAQGFLFPPELWKRASTLKLLDLIKKYLVGSREEALNSPFLDKESGNTFPIEIPDEVLPSPSSSFHPLVSDFEWHLATAVNKIANSREDIVIAIQGENEKFLKLLNKLMMHVPNELKPNLSWDSAFDNGNVTYTQVNIVGFTAKPPMGGRLILVNPNTEEIESPHGIDIATPTTPYEKWFQYCRHEVNPTNLDKAFALSRILAEGEGLIRDRFELLRSECFAQTNQDYIMNIFLRRCFEKLPKRLCNLLKNTIPTNLMLVLLAEGVPIAVIAEYLEKLIIEHNLGIEELGGTLPGSLVNSGSTKLQYLNKVLSGKGISPEEFRVLNFEDRVNLLKYALHHSKGSEDWIFNLLIEEKKLLAAVLEDYDIINKAKKILSRIFRSDHQKYRRISDIIIDAALKRNIIYELAHRQVNILKLLESILESGEITDSELEALIKWSKGTKPPEGNYPHIKVFLYPKENFPKNIVLHPETKKLLLKCLMNYHKFTEEQLLKVGFERAEILKLKEEMKKREGTFWDRVLRKLKRNF